MLKLATLLIASLISIGASAAAQPDPAPTCLDAKGVDISSNPDKFQTEIAGKKTCSEASDLAQKCAYGSSLDTQTADAAQTVCLKEMQATHHYSSAYRNLLATMIRACNKKYGDVYKKAGGGTIYISENAYCNLSATKWMDDLVTAETAN